MNVLSIGINKKRMTFALVKHKNITGLNTETKNFILLKLQYLYIPKNTFEKVSNLFYKFDNLEIIKQCDICRIDYHLNTNISAETLAIKEMLYLLLIEQLKKLKKKYYIEHSRVLQYRLGSGKFLGYRKIEPWILKNVEGLNREMLMGKRGILAKTVLAIASACDTKSSKYNW